MPDWGLPLFGAVFVGLYVMRIVAGHQLRAGNGRLAPFLVGPSVLILLFPLVAIALSFRALGLLVIPIGGVFALIAFLEIRSLLAIVKAGRSGSVDRVADAAFGSVGEAQLASMALLLLLGIVLGLGAVVYAIVNGGNI